MEQLLERYWQGETSVEEEARLREWFVQGNVPKHLVRYRDWFVYVRTEQTEHLSDDFEARIWTAIGRPEVKVRSLSLRTRFMPLLKAVAVVAFMVALGNVLQHPLWPEPVEVAAVDTIGKQITAPSVARSDDASLKQEKQLLDSLQKVACPDEHK